MLAWELPPHAHGGLGTACAGLLDGFARHGVEIELVAPSADTGPLPSAYGARASRDVARAVERYAQAAVEHARAARFDVIHAHDWPTWPAGMRARLVSGRPLVCHVHSIEHDRRADEADAWIEGLEREALLAADRVVCVSRREADVVAQRYGVERERLRVVHGAVEPAEPAARSSRSGPPVVLFLGRLTSQKAPERFLEVAARVALARPDVQFVLAGDGEQREALRARVVRLGLGERIAAPGHLDRAAVARALAAATVLVVPSRAEPFGLVALEALAHGVPAIVPHDAGVAEVADSLVRVDASDTVALSSAVLALLDDDEERSHLARAGRAEADAARWEDRAEQLVGVFGELVA